MFIYKKVIMLGKIKVTNIAMVYLVGAILYLGACKKYYNPPSVFEDYVGDSLDLKARKVLFISIDGFPGSDLKSYSPTNLTSLLSHSKYSFAQYNEDVETAASAWTSMMTGVSYSTHGVYDSTLAVVPDADADYEDAVTVYPSFMSKILLSKPSFTVSGVTPWAALNSILFRPFRKKLSVSNDMLAKDSAIYLLKNADHAVNILHLNEVAIAGNAGGYSTSSNPAYKGAIDSVDSYVGQAIEAIKSRATYANENWLVIVNSDHGDIGSVENERNRGFVIYYNPYLKPSEVNLNGSANAQFVTRIASPYAAVMKSADNNLAFGTTKNFTVEYTINLSSVQNSYAYFFNIRNASGTKGWGWISSSGTWQMQTTSGTTYTTRYASGKTINDGKWHTLTMTVTHPTTSQTLITGYFDGAFVSTTTVASALDFGTPTSGDEFKIYLGISPNQISATSERGCTQLVGKLKIFNIALTNDEIANNICLQNISQHSEYSHLIGYWACDENTGAVFKSGIDNGIDLSFQTTGTWVAQGTSAPCNQAQADPSILFSALPIHADIPANILYWLKIRNSNNTWNWSGTQWISNFESEYAR